MKLNTDYISAHIVPLIQQKLADVRLKELGVWLGAQSPKSPREIGTVLKKGLCLNPYMH